MTFSLALNGLIFALIFGYCDFKYRDHALIDKGLTPPFKIINCFEC